MNKPTPIVSPHADHEENIERIVKLLGRNKLKIKILDKVHGRGSKPKTVNQIMKMLGLPSRKRQLVLNAVNRLSNHSLIWKVPAPSRDDGARFAYGKIDYIMANKAEILRGCSNPERLKKIPTKRRPQVSVTVSSRPPCSVLGSKKVARGRLKVLYLTATPASQSPLRTDAEFRMVQDEVRGSAFRETIELIISPAADTKSVLNGINDHRPQIVHFSGHGGKKSIWIDDGKVEGSIGQSMDFKLLAETLAATSSPPTLLVLNACDTMAGARILLNAVKIVIAMSKSISDVGAATFAARFYAAIASAQPVSAALKQGRVSMKAAMLADAHLPKMICRKGINPDKFVLLRER